MSANSPLVEPIRSASRTLFRELGFMRATLAGTRYSASAVHALLEIDSGHATTAAQLVQALGLEKSSVSRMVGKLIEAGELQESPGEADARVKQLLLAPQGQQTVENIHRFGQSQVSAALDHLNPSEQQAVAQGLAAYARALGAFREGGAEAKASPFEISTGYQPGLIGRIAEMHGQFYARHWGFGAFFESKVASGLAEFAGRLDHPSNQVWVATLNGRIVGSVAIDGQHHGNHAHLRWFILDDGCRGSGVGRQLLEQALAFCDARGFEAVQLWTFKGLDAARRLYEAHGFALVSEAPGSQWGREVVEQQFTRQATRSNPAGEGESNQILAL